MSRSVLTIAIVMAFSMWAPLFVVPPIEKILTQALSLSSIQVSILFSGPVLMLCIAALPAGNLADKVGIKKIAGIGAIIIVIGVAMRGFSHDFVFLLISTMIYGLGIGWTFPNLPKLVRHCSPKEQTLLYMGIFAAGVVLAGAITLSITVPFVYPVTHTYNGVFFIYTLPPLVAAFLWWLFIKEPPCQAPSNFKKTNGGFFQSISTVLKNKNIWLISIVFLLHNFFLYTWTGLLPGYFTQKGATADISGLITSVIFFVGIPTVTLLPWYSMKTNIQRKLFIWIPSLLLIFASWAIISISLFWDWFLMILVGITTTIRFITIMIMPAEILPPEQAGTASGINISIAYIGALIGPLISGIILNGNSQAYSTIFYILMGISAATAVIGFFLPAIASKKQ